MFELHITPKKEIYNKFTEFCKEVSIKTITHDNLDINGNLLYSELMIAYKCKDLIDATNIILLIVTKFGKDILRYKIESSISDDFKYEEPYKLGNQYFESHYDVSELNNDVKDISKKFKAAISKNPLKNTYMLTYRNTSLEYYIKDHLSIIEAFNNQNINLIRVIKEYAFHDDNISLDNKWLNEYKQL